MNHVVRTKSENDPKNWFAEYSAELHKFAMRRLGDPELAEEMVQDTFVSGFQAIDQYRGTGRPGAWLMGILRRKIIDYYRRKGRRLTKSIDDSEFLANQVYDSKGNWRSFPRIFGRRPSQDMENDEIWEAFEDCIQSLPKRQAAAFELKEIEDVGSAEICRRLDISPSNLWVLLHRARTKLAGCLEQKMGKAISPAHG